MRRRVVPDVATLVYATRPARLYQLKPGDSIEHKGQVYRVFRLLRCVSPGGWTAVAVPRDLAGLWDGEAVAIQFDELNAIVRLVGGVEVPR